MASSSSSKVNLPPSVEEMLDKICRDQNVDRADYLARKALSSLDEAHSMDILQKISNSKIRKGLSCFIMHLVCKDAGSKNENGCSQGRLSPASVSCQYETNSPASSPKRPLGQMTSPQLLALGELEFRKAFLILSYLGKNRLEDVLKKDQIQRMNHLPMACVEEEVWKAFGRHSLCDEDRRNKVDWNSDETHLYHCHVDPDGSITFKGPYLHKTRTHLQRVLGDENVLNVRFADKTSNQANCSSVNNALYYNLGREGIVVGLRRYHFFVFKDGGKEEKKKNPTSSSVKCYFVCMDSAASVDEKNPCILFGKSIREARSLFMNVHTVPNMAKYMPRFSLILSKTMKLDIDLDSVHVELIDDIPCRDEEGNIVYIDSECMIHTDGTGFISEDLAVKCPKNIFRGDYSIHGEQKTLTKEPPLLIQCRLFYKGSAVKGTLLLNKMLCQKTIQIRRSMLKVETDPKLSNVPSFNSLEVVSTSHQPKRSCLSKNLIALLHYGGVPREYFMELLNNALGDAQSIHSIKRSALKVVMKYAAMDDYLATKMIGSGIPLDEPFLKYLLSKRLRGEWKSLKDGKLPVSESYILMGTADPTGKLNANEVCVILDNGQISGHVLVYRYPGLHFGDIHVLKATYVQDLESFVGNAKYAIFFPTKGPRSIADEMANGDFDGDTYWISRNQELLHYFKASEPWERHLKRKVNQRKSTEFSEEELENELFKQFLKNRFSPSYAAGIAAESWLAFMDRLLTFDVCEEEKQCMQEKMLELINLYYDALDAPKSGLKIEVPQELTAEQFPHYMEKRGKSYISTSILGQIYDTVEEFHEKGPSSEEVQLLPCFCQNVPDSCLTMWEKLYCDYRAEMTSAMSTSGESKDFAANEVYQRYKQILYKAPEFEESRKRREDIFNEALAIYQICYEYAKHNGVQLCGFAWKVAGSALCSLYMLKQGEDTMVWARSVVRELFG